MPETYGVWASESLVKSLPQGLVETFWNSPGGQHWSRVCEYPWAAVAGDFHGGDTVLDAAGGDSPFQRFLIKGGCQVINVDIDPSRQLTPTAGIVNLRGDIRDMRMFLDGVFERVACLSVLEHVERPLEAVAELWRVLKPGGRLTMTFDVADYARHNHTIDRGMAGAIFSLFGLPLPPQPPDVLKMQFPELQDGHGGNPVVNLNVLCLTATKRG